jgi:threonine/homoserine/homoserine lactone efflux protein
VPARERVPVVDTSVLLPFILSSLVIILSPGADTFLLLRFAIRGGPRAGFSAMFGILAGLSLVSLLLISGMGLLISQIPIALGIVNVVGIAVLVILAAVSVRAGLGLLRAPVASDQITTLSARDKPFRLSLVTNVTNPKVLIFYLAFFPQFLGEANSAVLQLTLLSAAFLVVTIVWLVPLVYAASAARTFFLRPRVAVAMEFTVAGVFLALAILLALTL